MEPRGNKTRNGLVKLVLIVAVALGVIGTIECCHDVQEQRQDDAFHQEYVAALAAGQGPMVAASSNSAPYASYWYYSQLSASDQEAYAAFYEALYMRRDSVDLERFNIEDEAHLAKIIDAVRMDCPEFSYDSGGGTYETTSSKVLNYTFAYTRQSSDAVAAYTQVNDACKQILAEVSQQKTTEQKVRVIHDAIAARCTFERVAMEADDQTVRTKYADSQTAYGVLVDGTAVCGGYSSAFEYLCHLAGIPCVYVSGTVATEQFSGTHAWNIVQVDGTWSVIDVTWDDQEQMPGGVVYDYYLISDSDHDYVTSVAVPTALPKASAIWDAAA